MRLLSLPLSLRGWCAASLRSYLLVCTGTGDLQIWDLEQSSLVSVGSAHSEEIMQAYWAPDGKQVVSVGNDACICVWNFYGTAKPPGAVRPPPQR